MGGRNAQPPQLHIARGNPNRLTKAELERRQKAQVKLGDNKLRCPAYVKNDVNAYAKWKEITKLYKDVDFVSSGDAGHLARYCVTFSEYLQLLKRKERIDQISMDSDNLEDYIDNSEEFNYKVKRQLKDMISTDGLLRLETAINKKMDMLIKMEDRLFLNPLAKVKNVPKKEPEKKDPLKERGFGNV